LGLRTRASRDRDTTPATRPATRSRSSRSSYSRIRNRGRPL